MAGAKYTDEQIFAGLRAAAESVDGPLSVATYDAWRLEHGGASGIGIIRRFGKWHIACERAGVEVIARPIRTTGFTEADVIAAVAGYLVEPDSSGSFSGYVAWAKQREGVPSGATVRNFLTWQRAKELARGRV